jgi:hypothetical protein
MPVFITIKKVNVRAVSIRIKAPGRQTPRRAARSF